MGEEHVPLRNKMINERVTGPDCQCKKKCFSNICDENKVSILTIFNTIGDKSKQDILLGGLICINPESCRKSRNGSGPNKSFSIKYEVRVGSTFTIVCKKAFCSLHGINKSRVERIIKKLKN